MNYWLINPKNEGTSTCTQNISVNLVKMGWDEDNCPKFYNDVEVGDIIIVCEGSHSNNKCHYVGVADKLDKDEHCWHLKHSSIDYNDIISDTIKSCPGDFGGGESKNPWGPSKSIICLESKPTEIKLKGTLNSIVQNMKIKELENILRNNSNLILTGAPGTGKTYLAKEIAAKLIFDKDYSNEIEQDELFKYHIGFVQFHPSYDYTDFVEGLRPKKKQNGFERVDGVFKKFCKAAIIPDEDFIKAHLKGHKYTFKFNGSDFPCVINKFDKDTRYFHWEGTEYAGINTNEQIINLDTISTIIKRCRGGEQLCEIIDAVSKDEKNQSQYFKCAASAICDDILKMKWVFIIDEINRGELSKIFGELFFSIDPGYRGVKGRVKTQYQNLVEKDNPFYDGFYVPENVYIIGTMNDIDRSVESMDFAIRRRFAWCEVEASDRTEMLSDLTPELAEKAIKSMEKLNNTISSKEIGLTSAYHIGPAYYLKLKNYDGNFESLWDYHIKGLLFEYLRGNKGIEKKLIELKEAFDAYKQA